MNDRLARGTRGRAARVVLVTLAVVGLGAVVAGCAGSAGGRSAAAGTQQVHVKVTENGFEPAELTVAKGKPIRLIMTRETDQTCARQVVFTSLKLKKELPLDQPVTIDLPAQPAGRIDYACGMDMVKGALVVH